ncbi:MAG: ABC transporter ATP-binding protein, partial [Acidimicrobiales bacterium]
MSLPVASSAQVRAYAKVLATRHRGPLARMLALYALASTAGLVPAWAVGQITNLAAAHTLSAGPVARYVTVLALASLGYGALTYAARRRAY